MQKKIRNTFWISMGVVIIMFAFSFALAPLYNTFCKVTGIGKLPTEKEFYEKADLTREITVQFTSTNNKNFAWDFYPIKTKIIVHPGEKAQIFFFAKNNTSHTMTVQAIPSIAPVLAITHFHKIQCFCFQQQTLKAGEEKQMAVVFKIDRELPRDIHIITLAYTLFDEEKKRTV